MKIGTRSSATGTLVIELPEKGIIFLRESEMQKVNLHVRPEDIRYVAITCKCHSKSTAEIPEQLAKAFNAHICPSCGQMYRITLDPEGNVTGKDGRKWIVSRGPTVDDVASLDSNNVAEALENMVGKNPDSCPDCKGLGRQSGTKCTTCFGTGRKDCQPSGEPTDKSQVN